MKKRILVVDDERWFTNLLEYSLEHQGHYDVRQHNDPPHALQAMRDYGPDLVILDIMMPHIDGSELAARMKFDPTLCDVPVFFMTALVNDEDAPDGLVKRGGHTFLPKDVAVDRLIACIEDKLKQAATAETTAA